MLRVLIPFLLGILAGIYLGFPNDWLGYLGVVLLLGLLLLEFRSKLFSHYRNRWVFGCLMNAILFIFGFQLTLFNTGIFNKSHFSNYSNESGYKVVRIYKQPIIKDRIVKLFGVVEQVKSKEWMQTSGNLMITLPKDSEALQVNYGDYLMIRSATNEIGPPMNPFEFDYRKYLSYQSVYQQVYLKHGHWVSLKRNEGNQIVKLACQAQKKLLETFAEYVSGKRELAVISALVLGDTDGIDNDLLNAYASTGAIHVLSVSGMHVGLIFIGLNFMLFFMECRVWTKILKAIIIISFLLFYAILTGLSPAVMRSAFMLSMIIIGKPFNRSHNILNTLVFSGFVLLLYDPFLIMNIGFLLSFFALSGIVVLHSYFKELYTFKIGLLDKLWSATCASFAAQIAVFPIAILFFHQFPIYFWLSNLFVWILTPFIMLTGIFLLVIQKFVFLSFWVGKVVALLVHLLNLSVLTINDLPFSLWKGISINAVEAVLIYLSIGFIFHYIIKRRPNYLIYGLVLLVLVLSNQFAMNFATMHQKKMVIYNINKHTGIDFIDGHSVTFVADENLIGNKSLINFHIIPNRGEMKINSAEIFPFELMNNSMVKDSNHLFIKDNFIQFFNKRLVIINDKNQLANHPFPMIVDYLMLINNPKVSIKELRKSFNFKTLIIGTVNSPYKNKKWIEECYQSGIKVQSIINSGAMALDF